MHSNLIPALVYIGAAMFAWFCVVMGYKPKYWKVRLAPGEAVIVHIGDTIEVPTADSSRSMKVMHMPERGTAICVDLQDMRYHHGLMALVAVTWPLGVPMLILGTLLHLVNRQGRLFVQPRASSTCHAVHTHRHAAPFLG